MTVTRITAVAVSFRTVTPTTSHARTPVRKEHEYSPPDSVELSQQAVAEARSTDPSVRRESWTKALAIGNRSIVGKAKSWSSRPLSAKSTT